MDDTSTSPATPIESADTGTPPEIEPSEPLTVFESYPDADLSDAEAIPVLAVASAARAYYNPYNLLGLSLFQTDPLCPEVTTTATTAEVVGGCTDDRGAVWEGSISLNLEDTDGLQRLVFDDFSYGDVVDCEGGDFVVNQVSLDGTSTMDLDGVFVVNMTGISTTLDLVGCDTVQRAYIIEYEGTQTVDGDVYVLNGAGRYADDVYGAVEASTFSEVLDETVCATAAVSGVTLLEAGGNEAALIYDGGVDCDLDNDITWRLNGVDQGEIAGVACTSTGVQPAAGVLAWLLLASTVRRGRRAGLAPRRA